VDWIESVTIFDTLHTTIFIMEVVSHISRSHGIAYGAVHNIYHDLNDVTTLVLQHLIALSFMSTECQNVVQNLARQYQEFLRLQSFSRIERVIYEELSRFLVCR
jgi:hypothetical protein